MKKVDKKVVFFIANFEIGGAETVTINIANELKNHVESVTILALNKNGPLIKNISKDVSLISLNSQRARGAFFKYIWYLFRSKPDFIFSSLDHTNFIALISKILFFRKMKVFVTEHSTPSLSIRASLFDNIIYYLKPFVYRLASGVICVSKGTANDLIHNFSIKPENLITIYNPVITPAFLEAVEMLKKGDIKRPLKSPYIISIGRLAYNKDLSTLIKAYSSSEITSSVDLVIAGEGPERKKLEELSKSLGLDEKIHFPGFVNDPIRWIYFSELFVMTSLFEGLPTALIEALGCSKKIISSDCPSGPSEILENGLWGALFEVGNYKQLSALISSKIHTDESPNTLPGCSRFTNQEAVSKYLSLME